MTRLAALCIGIALLGVMGWRAWSPGIVPRAPDLVFEPALGQLEPSPVCPWREPEADLQVFFPSATRYEVENRVLSNKRLQLQQKLQRVPRADESALRVFRVFSLRGPAGVVLTRRVKGEHGVIELVLAVREDQTVCGLRLQRMREPDDIAQALEDPAFLQMFSHQNFSFGSTFDQVIAQLPEGARSSGRAIGDGVRSALTLLELSNPSASPHLGGHTSGGVLSGPP